MNKRFFILLIFVIISTLVLPACSNNEPVSIDSANTKIEVPIFPDAIPDAGKYKDSLDKATEEFRSLSPGFNVESNLFLIPSVTDDDVYQFFNDALKIFGEGKKSKTEGGVSKFQWVNKNQEVTIYPIPDPTGAENILIVLNAWK